MTQFNVIAYINSLNLPKYEKRVLENIMNDGELDKIADKMPAPFPDNYKQAIDQIINSEL